VDAARVRRVLLLALVLAGGVAGATSASTGAGRSFGVYIDPWHVDEWAAAVGTKPDLMARFEAFSRQTVIDDFLRETERHGIDRVMVSWEPWKPVPVALGDAQSLPQRGYRNRDILHGVQDAYIRRFARSLATFRGTVYLRYAHEMNGDWYPWSHEPRMFTLAWRRVVRLFRAVGAKNVRFVWSVNPNLYQGKRPWLEHVRLYWPGSKWVDYVGTTMINFGGVRRAPRWRASRRASGSCKANTASR
jgi:hypothetical protein